MTALPPCLEFRARSFEYAFLGGSETGKIVCHSFALSIDARARRR
jgi:hypothetical protein